MSMLVNVCQCKYQSVVIIFIIMSNFEWNRDVTALLINLYEMHPNLYNISDKNYKIRTKRQESLKAIRTVLFENGYDFTIDDINKKIHGLRTQFFKEYRKVNKSTVSGCGAEDVYSPKLWCFNLLQFLINSDPIRESESNLIVADNSENQISNMIEFDNENQIQETEHQVLFDDTNNLNDDELTSTESEFEKNKKIKRSKTVHKQAAEVLRDATNILSSYKSNKENDLICFGKYITEEMKKIKDNNNLKITKRNIINLILDAQED